MALIAVPGAFALLSTDPSAPESHLVDGSYQRIYETRFQQALPGRDLAVHVWNAVNYAVLGEVSEGAVRGRDGWLFTIEEFQPPSDQRDLWAELDAARAELSAHGARLVPVIVPDKARIMASQLPVERSPRYLQRYDEVLAGLAQRGFPALDLRPALSSQPGQAPGFMKTDTHWSPGGASRVAELIKGAVDLDEFARAEFTVDATGVTPFEGDLLAFVNLGPFSKYARSLHEVIATYEVTASGAVDLFGDVEIPVALVGTSYSARTEFHFEDFLKSALAADVVSHAEVGLGPFEPMERYLATVDAAGDTHRLVIWEIPERYLPLADRD